jgi:putative ABC transport system permease protein
MKAMNTRDNTGLTAATLLILALAFGVFGAVLAVSKAVLWDEIPFREPSRLVEMSGILTEKNEVQTWAIGHLDFLDFRRQNRVFEALAAFTGSGGLAFNLRTAEGLERLDGELVSQAYFSTLGVEPALGRFFTVQEDTEPFAHPVTVLSHSLWRHRFGGDKGILGRKVSLNDKDWQVIGVAPEGFRGLSNTAEFWVPSSMVPGPEYLQVRRLRWLNAVARLKPGVTIEQAREDMNRITAALAQQYPDQNEGIGVKILPLREFLFGSDLAAGLRPALWGAALLLLLALVDAAGLLRSRDGSSAVGRRVLVSVAAAVLGLAFATWAIHALMPASGFTIPGFARLTPGPALIAGLLALAAVCGLAAGVLARWRGIRVLAGIAAVVQVVLAVGLLVRAGGMSRDFHQVVSRNLGYRTDNLLTLRLDLEKPQYAKNPDVARIAGEYLRRTGSLPEVEGVAITGPAMATDDWAGAFATAEDHDNPESDDGTYKVLTHGVSPDYFKLMGIPLVRGRVFNWQDTQGFHVILSEGMARQVWPGQNPLGKRIKFSARALTRPWLTVVGVVADTQYQGYFREKRPAPDFYLSVLQQPVRLPMILNVLARPKAGVSMASLETALTKAILAVTPDTPPYDVATLEQRLEKQSWKARFEVLVAALFAGLALVLALAAIQAARRSRRPDGAPEDFSQEAVPPGGTVEH